MWKNNFHVAIQAASPQASQGFLRHFGKSPPQGHLTAILQAPRQAYDPHISPGCSSSGSGLRRCGRSVPRQSCPPPGLLEGQSRREASPPPGTGPRRAHSRTLARPGTRRFAEFAESAPLFSWALRSEVAGRATGPRDQASRPGTARVTLPRG